MNIAKLILRIMGIFYMILGGGIALVFFVADGFSAGVLIPLIFFVIGVAFLVGVELWGYKKNEPVRKGKKFPAKIYGYVENTSYTVNNDFTINTIVHYFDTDGIEREAVLPTSFSRGSGEYPIGMTIDIFEYNGKFGYDPKSVRNEVLYREDELMDNKPVDPAKLSVVGIQCPNCAATFEAASGFANRCPYCGSVLNA